MTRKVVQIKEREVDIPLNVDQLLWHQYRSATEFEASHGVIRESQLVQAFLGESDEYWRGFENVLEYIQLTNLFYGIYLEVKNRTIREGPDKVIYAGKSYTPPSDLLWKDAGQYKDALDVISVDMAQLENHQYNEVLERIFKIYLYPIITGDKYTPEAALSWEAERARYIDVADFGTFFFLRLRLSPNGTKNKLRQSSTRWMKLKRVMMKLVPNMNLTA